MRRVSVVTFARSDYPNCRSLLKEMRSRSKMKFDLVVSGAHLSPEFGRTVEEIERDRFPISERVEMQLSSDTAEGTAKSIGVGVIGFAQSFSRLRPDVILIMGDRFELLSVAAAALPLGIPLAHVSGGDVTMGSADNQIRHAVSKMSHLHFVAMEQHRQTLLQMGEEDWRIFVTGDPSIDLIHRMNYLDRRALERRLGIPLRPPILVVTHHPATLGEREPGAEMDPLLAALSKVNGTLIFTYPNSDPGGRGIIERIQRFVKKHSNAKAFTHLGHQKYYSLLAQANLMIGNSSSGIWESASFQLPVVNIGDRQEGRLRAGNVLDVSGDKREIMRAIEKGLSSDFKRRVKTIKNPYGDGCAAAKVVDQLMEVPLGNRLLKKRFVERSVLS